jgi:hypothetical protein
VIGGGNTRIQSTKEIKTTGGGSNSNSYIANPNATQNMQRTTSTGSGMQQ